MYMRIRWETRKGCDQGVIVGQESGQFLLVALGMTQNVVRCHLIQWLLSKQTFQRLF